MTTLHDPTVLPADIPAPQDDGGARHLTGMRLPSLPLAATDGSQVDLSKLAGRTVVYIYPRTGVPGQPLPEGWDAIPGARGCTPQSCCVPRPFRRAQAARRRPAVRPVDPGHRLSARGGRASASAVPGAVGRRTSRSPARIKLPTFTVAGMTLLKRMALVIDDGVITKVFYPVFPPDKNAEEVMAWLRT